ncbi:MAG TPA: hypothetical protein VGN20_21485 [Mucilaginibacter sp.]
MRNKPIFLFALLSFLFVIPAFCQEKSHPLSLNVYGGYGFLSPSGDNFTVTGDANSTGNGSAANTFIQTKEGLGIGSHTGIGFTLKLTEFISAGIDADYLTGKKNIAPGQGFGAFASNHSVLSIIPNVSVKFLRKPKYNIYNTIGIIAAVKTKFDYSYITSTTEYNTFKYKYGINAGLKDALGFQVSLYKNISVFAEVTGYFLPVRPTSATIVQSSSDSQSAVTVINYNITYKNSGSYNFRQTTQQSGNITTSTNSYTDQAPVQHIYSVGLNAGVRLNLGKINF